MLCYAMSVMTGCDIICCYIICYALLCYALLCYAMPCYDNANANANAMLCYAMLCCAMLCYAMRDIRMHMRAVSDRRVHESGQ